MDDNTTTTNASHSLKVFPRSMGVLLFALIAIIITLGYLYFNKKRDAIKQQKYEELSVIADMKVRQIQQWRHERLGDAYLISGNNALMREIGGFVRHPAASPVRNDLLWWMQILVSQYGYRNVQLIDSTMTSRLQATPEPDEIGQVALRLIPVAMRTHDILFSDLHRSQAVPSAHFDIIVPILDPDRKDTGALGVALLRIAPQDYFFPVIQSWPTPSRTSETVLLERQGDSVAYLNDLRFQHNTALTLRFPLSDTELPAVKAVQGINGMVEGPDYRHVSVLAAIRKITDTPWFMVAKVDQEEIFSDLREEILIVSTVTALLVLLTVLSFGLVWRHQLALFYRRQLDIELHDKALTSHFQYLVRYANDIILLLNGDGRIVEVNDQACKTYGYTREELLRLTHHNLQPPERRGELTDIVNRLTQEEGLVYETMHLRKDGSTFPVEGSARMIRIDDRAFIQIIFRDITERLQAEQRLRELAEIVNSSEDAIIGKDLQGNITSWNNGAGKLYGYTEEEMLGKSLTVLIPSGHENDLPYLLARVRQEKQVASYETVRQRKDGEQIHVSLTLSPIKNRQGAIIGASSIARDVSIRKQAEEAIRKSEQQFRSLFENMLNGFAYCRMLYEGNTPVDFVYLDVNRAFEKLTGLKDVAGKKVSAVIPGIRESNPELFETYGRVAHSGVPESFETYVEPLNIWFSISVYSPQVEHFVAVFDNITERKRVQMALQENEARLRRFYESGLLGVIYWDMSGNIIDANDRFLAMTGYSREDLASGKLNWVGMTPPSYRFLDEESMAELRTTGVNSAPFEKEFIRKDGTRMPIIIAGAMLDEKLFNGVAFVLDITDRKQIEEELRQKNEELTRFVYTVSHDLKSPLVTIKSFSGFLKHDIQKMDDAAVDNDLHYIQNAADKMGDLLDDLLELSRIGRKDDPRGEFHLQAIVRTAIDMVAGKIRERGVRVSVTDAPVVLFGSETRLIELFENLIDNAVKFMGTQPEPLIEIGAKSRENDIVLFVRDNGSGIDLRHAGKIFGLFEKLDQASEGTGIGLALVRRIVEVYHGAIWFESGGSGKGATFYFTLENTRHAIREESES